jgi:membrane protease YdiL (CAAX protease family)
MTLAIVRRRTGSLYPGMLMHFLHNLAVVILFT